MSPRLDRWKANAEAAIDDLEENEGNIFVNHEVSCEPDLILG
jgi:hypothetical protein